MLKLRNALVIGAVVTLPLLAMQASAKVSPAEAAKLGGELTMVGAIKAGNADGSISAFEGSTAFTAQELSYTYDEIQAMSKAEQAAALERATSESPTFTITAANFSQYADQLTEGHQALFTKFPSYTMPVYKTRRVAFYPQAILDATKANATTAYLEGPDGLRDASLGFPFPIPTGGAEPIWNHKTKFRGDGVTRYNDQAIVKTDGTFKLTQVVEDVLFTYANISKPGSAADGMLLYYLQTDLGASGARTLVHETSDQAADPRKAWLYTKSFGRLKRAPNVGYDNPSQTSDGEQFNDQVDMFNGAMDLYDWKLVGLREMYIPYNSAKINSPLLSYADILKAGHLNQSYARYELHRVWVVEATQRAAASKEHKLSRRTFYIDEDSWSIAGVDGYDKRGELWKFQEGHLSTAPFIPTTSAIPEVIYDLQSGRYFATAMVNEQKISDFSARFKLKDFKPGNVAKSIK